MIDGVLIAVEVAKIASRVDGSVTISLDTPELSPAKFGEIFALRKQQAFCYLKPSKIDESEQKAIDGLRPDLTGGKSMGQRLRAVLYVAWKQNNEGYQDHELYYRYKMEKFIEHVKSKLEPNA
jgi:hypothetical protein